MMDETQVNSKLDWRTFEADPCTVYFLADPQVPQPNGLMGHNHITLEGPHAVERARLIAAAPAMYEACVAALASRQIAGAGNGSLSRQLEAAIAKVRGHA